MNILHALSTPVRKPALRRNKLFLILLIGILSVFILTACNSGGDSDNGDSDDTAEVSEDPTPTPEGVDEDSDTTDETDTDSQTADETDDETDDEAEATEETESVAEFEIVEIEAFWQPDAFVMRNDGEETVNLFGILLADGSRRFRLGTFMLRPNVMREFAPGTCVVSYGRGGDVPEWVSEICPELSTSEMIATTNFVWTTSNETFNIDIRGEITTCTVSEGQCTFRVRVQDVGR